MQAMSNVNVSHRGDRYLKQTPGKLKLLFTHHEMIAAMVSGLFIVIGWILSTLELSSLAVASFILAFVIGGYAKAKEGIEELIFQRQLNVNMLMIFAAIGSGLIGYWAEGAILIFIFSLSGALETYALNNSQREITRLMALQPEEARLYEDGVEKSVPVERLTAGQTVVVKAGDRIPVDGTVLEGTTTVDQSTITGESVPVEKTVGDKVLAGTINGSGLLFVRVDKAHKDTLFQRMIRLVQQAQTEKPPQQHFVERFEVTYVKVVLIAVGLMMVLPPYVLNWSWNESIYRSMVLLVVASPCALVASIMPALLSAISNGARRGVLFKGSTHVQKLESIKVIAFDKTGTLTRGVPEVTDVVTYHGIEETELIQATASIERMSTHPLAAAIVREAEARNISLLQPESMENITGFGVQATIDGELWKIGKRELLDCEPDERIKRKVDQFADAGKTVIYVQKNDQVVGLFAVKDVIRKQTKDAIKQLKKQGIYTVMITGDSPETAKAIAREAGIDAYYANCLPDEKVARIGELRKAHGDVAMVGDGVNDAPALASASVGIGMGAGTDVALETADIVLVENELLRVPFIVRMAKRAGNIIKQNVAFSLAVIALLIVGNFLQSVTLPLGVIGHEGSTILVILNGLRLLMYRE